MMPISDPIHSHVSGLTGENSFVWTNLNRGATQRNQQEQAPQQHTQQQQEQQQLSQQDSRPSVQDKRSEPLPQPPAKRHKPNFNASVFGSSGLFSLQVRHRSLALKSCCIRLCLHCNAHLLVADRGSIRKYVESELVVLLGQNHVRRRSIGQQIALHCSGSIEHFFAALSDLLMAFVLIAGDAFAQASDRARCVGVSETSERRVELGSKEDSQLSRAHVNTAQCECRPSRSPSCIVRLPINHAATVWRSRFLIPVHFCIRFFVCFRMRRGFLRTSRVSQIRRCRSRCLKHSLSKVFNQLIFCLDFVYSPVSSDAEVFAEVKST